VQATSLAPADLELKDEAEVDIPQKLARLAVPAPGQVRQGTLPAVQQQQLALNMLLQPVAVDGDVAADKIDARSQHYETDLVEYMGLQELWQSVGGKAVTVPAPGIVDGSGAGFGVVDKEGEEAAVFDDKATDFDAVTFVVEV